MQYIKRYNKRKDIGTRKKKDLMSRIWDKKEETIVELESGSVPYRGKSTAE